MSSDAIRQRQRALEGAADLRHRPDADRKSPDENDSIPQHSNLVLLLKISIFGLFFVPLVMFLIYVLVMPANYMPVEYSLPPTPLVEGTPWINDHLLKAEKLYEGKVIGAETIIYDKGHIYTGTADGKVLHIHQGRVEVVAHFGKKLCSEPIYSEEPICGRPLGMKFDPEGYLLVIDPYFGLFRVNVATGDVHLLLPSGTLVDGQPMNFMNSLDVDSDGLIYLTDSSVYLRRDFLLDALDGRPTGRLLRYDPVKNSTQVLLNNLRFANGLHLSRYEDFILVSETYAARILKYNIKGINAGHTEVFADNLPGFPDNIKRSSSGGFWVALPTVRKSPDLLTVLGPRNWIRLILGKVLRVLPIMDYLPTGTMVVELNSGGEMVRTLMDRDGQHLRLITEVEDVAGVLYLGSFREAYIARIDASKLH